MAGPRARQRGEWPLAAAFCTLWKAALGGARGLDVHAITGALSQLKERIGHEEFAVLYAQHAGSTPTPTPTPEARGATPPNPACDYRKLQV